VKKDKIEELDISMMKGEKDINYAKSCLLDNFFALNRSFHFTFLCIIF